MEGKRLLVMEDISAKMMRRARCLHSQRYSTDALANVKTLESEKEELLSQRRQHALHQHDQNLEPVFDAVLSDQNLEPVFDAVLSDINQLIRLWRWVSLVEDLCREQQDREENITSNNSSMNFSSSHSGFASEEPTWAARDMRDAGILKLLRMSSKDGPDDNINWMDSKSTSEVLFCDEFDSPMRRSVIACDNVWFCISFSFN